MALYNEVQLGISDSSFVLAGRASVPGSLPGDVSYVAIERLTDGLTIQDFDPGQSTIQLQYIGGVLGIINLISGPCLVIFRNRLAVGSVCGHMIYRVDQVEILPFAKNYRHLSDNQVASEAVYIGMLRDLFEMPAFYFSYTYDLTNTLQRIHSRGAGAMLQTPLIQQADRRFVWNRHLLQPLQSIPELSGYLMPIIHGFISTITSPLGVGGVSIDVALISRRHVRRAGTRFNRRGIDNTGHVANYVETEMVTRIGQRYTSFTQTRGSIPLFWSQTPNIRYKPKVVINASADHFLACKTHLMMESRLHGRHVCINLINDTGHEGAVCNKFSGLMQTLVGNELRYVYFNFHKECARMNWGRLSRLMDTVHADVVTQGCFVLENRGSVAQIHSFQRGVFRTNCIDCLDRTNVVQNMLARQALDLQLKQMQLVPPSTGLSDLGSFEKTFKALWADNGDTLAEQYGGSGALKGDFTRTGQRTFKGLLRDGALSLLRYYRNNFADGPRQDAIDLLLGNHTVNGGEGVSTPSPFARRGMYGVSVMLLLALIVLSCMLSAILVVQPPGYHVQSHWSYWAAWVILVFSFAQLVSSRHGDLVSLPALGKSGS